MTDATFPVSAGRDRDPAASLFRTLKTRLRQAQAISRARAELMMLDDRMLADIGLRRSDIGAAVEGGRGR